MKETEIVEKSCRAYYERKTDLPPAVMAKEIMEQDTLPMHHPYHHYIVPAVLLTKATLERDIPMPDFLEMMQVARARAEKVPGAICGSHGVCGAAIGAGIFASVWTDATPFSKETWGFLNRITGIALQVISEYTGPRCCKRVTFLSIEAAGKELEQKFNLHLNDDEDIVCTFFKGNKECIGINCKYYPKHIKNQL